MLSVSKAGNVPSCGNELECSFYVPILLKHRVLWNNLTFYYARHAT